MWTIQPSGVEQLSAALNTDDDVLTALVEQFSGDAAANLQSFLDEKEIPYECWSRIGD